MYIKAHFGVCEIFRVYIVKISFKTLAYSRLRIFIFIQAIIIQFQFDGILYSNYFLGVESTLNFIFVLLVDHSNPIEFQITINYFIYLCLLFILPKLLSNFSPNTNRSQSEPYLSSLDSLCALLYVTFYFGFLK